MDVVVKEAMAVVVTMDMVAVEDQDLGKAGDKQGYDRGQGSHDNSVPKEVLDMVTQQQKKIHV